MTAPSDDPGPSERCRDATAGSSRLLARKASASAPARPTRRAEATRHWPADYPAEVPPLAASGEASGPGAAADDPSGSIAPPVLSPPGGQLTWHMTLPTAGPPGRDAHPEGAQPRRAYTYEPRRSPPTRWKARNRPSRTARSAVDRREFHGSTSSSRRCMRRLVNVQALSATEGLPHRLVPLGGRDHPVADRGAVRVSIGRPGPIRPTARSSVASAAASGYLPHSGRSACSRGGPTRLCRRARWARSARSR